MNSLKLHSSKILNPNEADLIQKGHLNEVFQYSDIKNLSIEKTGKEIKESLDGLRTEYENERTALLVKLEKLKIEGIEPLGNISEYRLAGFSSKAFNNLPKLYNWDQKRPYNNEMETKRAYDEPSISLAPEDVQSSTNTFKQMCSYNDVAEKIAEDIVEIKIIDTLKAGLVDNKKYQLSLRQAAAFNI